jgi:hypothetical protein
MRIRSCVLSAIAVLVFALASAANAVPCESLWTPTPPPDYQPLPSRWIYPPWTETNWFLPETPANLLDHEPPATEAGVLSFWASDFTKPEYWHRFQLYEAPFYGEPACEKEVAPQRSEDTYVSFGVVAVLEENDDLEMGQLYVGGWSQSFDHALDAPHRPGGKPLPSDFGLLRIDGGSLEIGGCTCEDGMDPETSPPCVYDVHTDCYERVGYRGTYGEVVQHGGVHKVANAISLGIGSSCLPGSPLCSHGVYRLNGGTLEVPSMDCGVQGKGEFHMTGGFFDSSLHRGSFFVGRRYTYPTAVDGNVPIAGHCTFTQSGGLLSQGVGFFVGTGTGATGVMTISGDADFDAFGTGLWAGGGGDDENGNGLPDEGGGTATITQTGGDVSTGWFLMLGARAGGQATYTISGGNLAQTSCCGSVEMDGVNLARGMYVGHLGRGELVVEGADSTIAVAGEYHQGGNSLLTFKIEQFDPFITPIVVAKTATFEPGAKLKLEVLGEWTPAGNQPFTVLSAANGVVGESNLTLDAASGTWSLNWTGAGTPASPRKLVVTKLHPCGLLGIEPVVVLALLGVRRRWSGARAPRGLRSST